MYHVEIFKVIVDRGWDDQATFSAFYVVYPPSLEYSHITLSSGDGSKALP